MNKLGFYHYYAFLWLSHRQFLMPRYSSWASYNSQPMVKRMLSLFMCKTFLSILAVPNMTDFCTIPTFNLIPSESIHPLRPLLMHPRAPTTTSTTQPFPTTKAFSVLTSNSDISQSFRILSHVSYNHLV